ncbi:MAG TPA: transcription termination/antitermination protein NusA [Candidatus Woesebacteria bacterium]|nr:transcription termination/antitermination protein NusA [Candidatus Woesebacteria bacterium]
MDIKKLPKTEFAASIAQVAGERGVEVQDILDIIEESLITAFKRDQKEHGVVIDEATEFEVELSPESGSFAILEKRGNKSVNVTPPGFGRIAAQTAFQVLKQGLSQIQHEKLINDYKKRIGTLIKGTIVRIDQYKYTVDLDNKIEAYCPKDESVYQENMSLSDRKLFLIKSITQDDTGKKDIILSRKDSEFIKQLFTREVPEVGDRSVTIERVARIPGERTKIAVFSTKSGIDPVGSCIGQKGTRIQAVLSELPQSEKVDVIAFSKNQDQFIANALSPAENVKVLSIKNNIAVVEVAESDLALAIGGGGENVRLAGLLTSLDIKVQGAK